MEKVENNQNTIKKEEKSKEGNKEIYGKEKVREEKIKVGGGEKEKEVETKEKNKKNEKEKLKKIDESKKEKKVKVKKNFAIAKANNLPVSTKKAVAICKIIKGKHPKEAISIMEQVIKLKKSIPMVGEIPHRKKSHRLSKHAQGRYPAKPAKYFVKVLKQAIANANQVGLEEDKLYIYIAKADKGSTLYRPGRFWRRRFKRTNLYIEIRER